MRQFFLPVAAAFAASCSAPAVSAAGEEAPRTMTIVGAGEVSAAPDMALITIGVQTDGATAAEALRANSAAMTATIDKLKAANIPAKDIQTTGLSVNPQYNYERNRRQPELIGFRAANTVRVKMRDLDEAGAVIDDAISSGANTLSGISFTFAEPKPLYEAARRDAVSDAMARAQLLADAADVNLGAILNITDSQISTPRPDAIGVYAARMEADAAVPLEAGESLITARVTIVFEIE
jgi:uncharacterized protein YggE